jgi:hypothetical protein
MSDVSSAERDNGDIPRATELEKAQTTKASWLSESHEDLGEIKVAISSHRRNATAYLSAFLDTKARLSNTSVFACLPANS